MKALLKDAGCGTIGAGRVVDCPAYMPARTALGFAQPGSQAA